MMRRVAFLLITVLCGFSLLDVNGRLTAQESSEVRGLHRPLDEMLDLNVRDGLVYYRALKGARGQLDRYIASLDVNPATYQSWSRDDRVAFWLNAYNAFVLETVIDRYPIRGTSAAYPANSIRQISGAFERMPHRAAGKTLTLDDIEKTILPEFGDPRLYLVLGRGALDSGRLRSEAFTGDRLELQLSNAAQEFSTLVRHVKVDEVTNTLSISAIFGWHEAEFIKAYADESKNAQFASRSPIERAVVSFIQGYLLPGEIEYIHKNQFSVKYIDFDWRLNDLTGGNPR